jgi:hypothetical protein
MSKNVHDKLIAGQWLGLVMIFISPVFFIMRIFVADNSLLFLGGVLIFFGFIFRSMGTRLDSNSESLKWQRTDSLWVRIGLLFYKILGILCFIGILIWIILKIIS